MKKITTLLLLLCSILLPNYAKGDTFEIGDKTFLLNGKPFVIKAAEVHYPRIPEPYWEQRIETCKSLGMNTLCLYVFWNLHEQEEGKFDFSENNDIAKFCKLAQKHGMYVIVRPGPYVCAEWEMGGLPWWLLKKKDVKLRTQDPYYMERVQIFMNEVGKQLAPLQITKGGNIIMVQVENEYGSYGIDKPYISAIRDGVRNAGFNEVPLFQCDWSSNFTNNALDDLMWTVNFGTGANIKDNFSKLKELRPNTPLMCSEFWSGWFDHWGRKHETRKAETMVSGIKEMLDNNISFSLYMTHGGTTFGWWGGANNPAYSAMCSSYDYDAPISESGWLTPKYYLLRSLLAQYVPKDSVLPAAPAQISVMSIPAITEWKVAPLFSTLPKGIKSKEIKPMEDFNQGWGTILYRNILKEDIVGNIFLDEMHDWAQIFADGKLIGRLDRRHGEFTLTLSETLRKGTQLDILVDAMGRVNFDKSIHDRKGITNKVEATTKKGKKIVLKDWEVFNMPPFYDFVASRNFNESKAVEGPAYYKATFTLGKVADTFLDMQTWGKGLVWVNGHTMGRFWGIGPQQTLYMPGCWLKEGVNEIIVLDILGPKGTKVVGRTEPILDMLREKAPETHRKEDQTLDLSAETPIYSGTFVHKNGWQEIKLSNIIKGQYFCINATSNFDGNNIASIAEFDILDENGNKIPREKWSIAYADSEETRSGNHTADKIYDLQESTYWQTIDNTAYPHAIVINLGKQYKISGFKMLPRVEEGAPGEIKHCQIYIKVTDFKY